MRSCQYDTSIASEQRNSVWKDIDVVCKTCQTLPIPIDHRSRANRVEVIDVNVRTRAFDVEDHGLASLAVASSRACYITSSAHICSSGREILEGLDMRTCIVVVEETIQSRAIDQDALRVHNPQTPAISAVPGNAAR